MPINSRPPSPPGSDRKSDAVPRLHGVVPPLVTPLTDTGDVDRAALSALVAHLLAQGVHGLFPLGSTGEVGYLTDPQRDQVIRTVVAATEGRVPVLAGCIDLSASRVVEQARRAEQAGADVLVVTPPVYLISDAAEVADHFRIIKAAVDLPLVAYDIPVRVHSKLSAETLMLLAAEGVLVGVKDSSGDDIAFRRLLRANEAAGHPLALFSGHELVCDAMLLAGADGLVPGLANVDAAGYVRLYDAARSGDWSAAVREQERLADLFEIVFASPGRSADARGVGAFKVAMVELGLLPSATMAAPVTGLDQSAREAVAAIVHAWQAGSRAAGAPEGSMA